MRPSLLLLILLLAVVPVSNRSIKAPIPISTTSQAMDEGSSRLTISTDSGFSLAPLIYSAVHSSLARPSGNGTYELVLAESITISDNGSMELVLREGLKFASGGDLSTEDVIFSYRVALTPAIDVDLFPFYGFNPPFPLLTNDSIRATGNNIVFNLTATYAFPTRLLTLPIIEKARYNEQFEGCLAGVEEDCVLDDKIAHLSQNWFMFDGAGGYMVSSSRFVNFGNETHEALFIREVTLKRNPYYFGTTSLDELVIRLELNVDEGSGEQGLANGTVDVILDDNRIFNSSLLDPDIIDNILLPTAGTTNDLYLNHLHPIWGTGEDTPLAQQDSSMNYTAAKAVRKAIAHLIDQDRIIDEILNGFAWPLGGPIPPSSLPEGASISPYPFSIATAKAFMEEAGYNFDDLDDTNDDGIYESFFFNVTLLTPNNNLDRMLWANLTRDQFAKIGIRADQNVTDLSGVIGRLFADFPDGPPIYDNGGYDLMFLGLSNPAPQWDPQAIFRTQDLFPLGFNFLNYANATLDTLINNYITTFNEFERTGLLLDIQKHYKEEVVAAPILASTVFMQKHCSVQGINPVLLPFGIIDFQKVELDPTACVGYIPPTADSKDPLVDTGTVIIMAIILILAIGSGFYFMQRRIAISPAEFKVRILEFIKVADDKAHITINKIMEITGSKDIGLASRHLEELLEETPMLGYFDTNTGIYIKGTKVSDIIDRYLEVLREELDLELSTS